MAQRIPLNFIWQSERGRVGNMFLSCFTGWQKPIPTLHRKIDVTELVSIDEEKDGWL